jgi:hypothetical protein
VVISDSLETRGSLPPVDPTAKRVRLARIIAVAVDAVQIALLPAFAGGALSPLNDAIDVGVALLMMYLVGWHWAFLPTFVAELVPGLGLIPTWTAAVWFVTRKRGGGSRQG